MSCVENESCFSAWPHLVLCRHTWQRKSCLPHVTQRGCTCSSTCLSCSARCCTCSTSCLHQNLTAQPTWGEPSTKLLSFCQNIVMFKYVNILCVQGKLLKQLVKGTIQVVLVSLVYLAVVAQFSILLHNFQDQ